MIRVNLLQNQLNVSETRPKTLADSTASTVIRQEAKKSSRFFFFLIIFFSILIGGGVSAYLFRYEVVAFIEQYTGPLNLLTPVEPEISSQQLEEQRREKIRAQYIHNTYILQKRNHAFLARIDSLDQTNDRIWISRLTLDVNDFNIELYGKGEKDLSDFFIQVVATANTELLKQNESKASSAVRGYALKKNITGSLKVSTEPIPENYAVPVFYSKDTVLQKIQEIAKKTGVKFKTDGKSILTRGVVMDKMRGTAQAEALSAQLILFLQHVYEMKLNVEWVSYSLSHTVQSGKRKTKPDNLKLDYEIFIPSFSSTVNAASH